MLLPPAVAFSELDPPYMPHLLPLLPGLQDYRKPCPAKQPTAEALAQRTTAPKVPKPAAAAPPLSKNINPPGSEPAVCNAYLPGGTSTMARFLWVVQYFVANGFYVLIDYHPEPGNVEPVTESVDMFTGNWLRLWAGLSCLPNFQEELQGRVFLDLMNGAWCGWVWAAAPTAREHSSSSRAGLLVAGSWQGSGRLAVQRPLPGAWHQ